MYEGLLNGGDSIPSPLPISNISVSKDTNEMEYRGVGDSDALLILTNPLLTPLSGSYKLVGCYHTGCANGI